MVQLVKCGDLKKKEMVCLTITVTTICCVVMSLEVVYLFVCVADETGTLTGSGQVQR